jgi:hypothetical protein
MALKYEQSYNTTHIGKKEINYLKWTAKTEREYIKLIETKGEDTTDKDIYDILIAPNIKEKDLVLSTNEQKLLLITLRRESFNKYLQDRIKCSECSNEQEIKADLNEICSFKEHSFKEIVSQDLKVKFSPLKRNEDKSDIMLGSTVTEFLFSNFLVHVESITMNEETHTDLSFDDKWEFFDSLPVEIFDELFEAYLEMQDELVISVPFKCEKCSHEENLRYEQIPNFLWI